MNLNHLDLLAADIHMARAFFEAHFGLLCWYSRCDEMAMLKDKCGFSLGFSNLGKNPAPIYPPDFHIGFVLKEAAQVVAAYERMKSAGVAMKYELSEGGPNLYFTFLGPDGIPVEVSAPRGEAPQ